MHNPANIQDDLPRPAEISDAAESQVTVVFGMGGSSPPLFRKLRQNGLHFFSYGISDRDPWPESEFNEHEAQPRMDGRSGVRTAERESHFPDGLSFREVRCVFGKRSQLAILSSDHALDLNRIAADLLFRMVPFFRVSARTLGSGTAFRPATEGF
jgi:hypothetical protein